ncbi:MAG: octanoyltransferase, partial [Pseudomonas amygdali]
AMTQLSDQAGQIEFSEVSARLRAQLVKHLDYAEQATLTGGINHYD